MNIGLDFDQTITDDPGFFREFVRSMSKRHKIYIISSCSRRMERRYDNECRKKESLLKRYGISHSGLFVVREPIPKNKARLCARYKIDLMIDDKEQNLREIAKSCRGTVCLRLMQKR